MEALLKLIPWYVRWGAFALLILASMAFGAAKMHEHDEKRYNDLVKEIATERAAWAAKDAEKERIHEDFIRKQDEDYETAIAQLDDHWRLYWMHNFGGGTSQGTQSVPTNSKICADPARDKELSGAIDRARSETRGAVVEYRQGVAGLLRTCSVQAESLENLENTWEQLQVIEGGK